MKSVLVTGSAGFIGSALSLKLLESGHNVVGIDNLNDYYDIELKKDRLARHEGHAHYKHYEIDIENEDSIVEIFRENKRVRCAIKFEEVLNAKAKKLFIQ